MEGEKQEGQKDKFRERRAMLLVNHAFACVTPAMLLIFVVSTGSEKQSPCFAG